MSSLEFYFRLSIMFLKPIKIDPDVRFSKVSLIYGPGNLSGPLSGNFIGPGNAFLKAPGLLPIFLGIFSGFVAPTVARA